MNPERGDTTPKRQPITPQPRTLPFPTTINLPQKTRQVRGCKPLPEIGAKLSVHLPNSYSEPPEMLRQISSSVYCWSEIHGVARNEAYLWNSYVINAGDQGIALVDPLPLSSEELEEVETIGRPCHILLTCNDHLRESETFKRMWGCKIFLHKDGLGDAEVPIDRTVSDGDVLWDLVRVIHVPDVHYPEEIALLVMGDLKTMIIGDLVCGGRKDRGIPDGQIWINAPEYMEDLQAARASLLKLKDYPFDSLCFGHGTPIPRDARTIFSEFVDSDAAWIRLDEEKFERADSLSREFLKARKLRRPQ